MKNKALTLIICSLILSSCSIPTIGSEEKEVVITETPETTTDTPAEPTDTKEGETVPVIASDTATVVASDTPTAIAEGGVFLPYTPTAVTQAKGKIVLFFYASWSPISLATNKDIEANTKNIPSDLTILRVNFDDALDLRDVYKVEEQSTFVMIDNAGKELSRWRGQSTLTQLVQKISE